MLRVTMADIKKEDLESLVEDIGEDDGVPFTSERGESYADKGSHMHRHNNTAQEREFAKRKHRNIERGGRE